MMEIPPVRLIAESKFGLGTAPPPVGWLNRLRGDGSPVLIVICVDSLETQPRLR